MIPRSSTAARRPRPLPPPQEGRGGASCRSTTIHSTLRPPTVRHSVLFRSTMTRLRLAQLRSRRRAPLGEKIAAAAVNLNNRIFTGADHAEALMKAESELGIPFDQMTQAPIMDGFTTTSGRFISRREAAEIAQREGQGETRGIFGATRGLASEDTSPAPAPAAAGNRTGATALGLMGGQGVWGVVQQPERPASGVLWHRSDRPASLDAAGLQDYEIQESLRNAWDNGYDSVLMKNYIRPGGTKPESIMVVRNLNQLRSPRAAFDPEKKLSPNILAGFGAVAAYPASSVLRPLDHDSDQSRIRTTDAGHGHGRTCSGHPDQEGTVHT